MLTKSPLREPDERPGRAPSRTARGLAIRKASIAALIVAIVLFALDGILGIYSTLDAGALIPMVQAIGPARALRASAKLG